MAWLQPQPTRKRPEYLCNWNRHLRCRVPLHGRGGPYILSKNVFQSGNCRALRVCQEPFPLRVLVFQRLQPLAFGYVHAAEFGTPFIDAGIADTVLAAKLRDRRAASCSLRMPMISSSVKRLRFIPWFSQWARYCVGFTIRPQSQQLEDDYPIFLAILLFLSCGSGAPPSAGRGKDRFRLYAFVAHCAGEMLFVREHQKPSFNRNCLPCVLNGSTGDLAHELFPD